MSKNNNHLSPVERIEEIERRLGKTKHRTQMQFSSKWKSVMCLVLAMVLLCGGALAYFTDYATTQVKGTAGTVEISLIDNINLLNDDGKDIINPGDKRDASITIQNEGNKSVDTRATITLTGKNADGEPINFTGDATTQSEYDLYLESDVEYIEGEGWKPKDGAQPLQVKSIDGDEITYELPIVSLNGNSDKHDEYETIDGVNEYAHTYDIVFIMKAETGNEWQNSKVTIEVEVEAKQHENTGDDWTIVDKVVDSNLPRHILPEGPVFGEAQFNMDTQVVVFTNKPIPDGVDASSISDDGKVKAWVSDTFDHEGTSYDLSTLYITTVDGGIIEANEDSSYMFSPITANGGGWSDLVYIDFGNLDISNAKNTEAMFKNCENLIQIKASNWTNEASVTNDTDMFEGCVSLIGAVPFNEDQTGFEMANLSGYFVGKLKLVGSDEDDCPHNWVDTERIEANCISDGYQYQACSFCGSVRSDKIADMTGHSYVETVVPATEDAQGYTLHQCENCTHSYRDNYTDFEGGSGEQDPVEPEIPVNACPGTDGHKHVEETLNGVTYIYCEGITTQIVEANKVYKPYSHWSGSGENECSGAEGHNHIEEVIGSYTYIYCEDIISSYRDGNIVYYPYSYYY